MDKWIGRLIYIVTLAPYYYLLLKQHVFLAILWFGISFYISFRLLFEHTTNKYMKNK